MVDGEPQLVPVLALLPRRAVGRAAADAGVVDEDVELRRCAASTSAASVRTSSSDARSAWNVGRAAELGAQLVELLPAAAVEEHLGPAGVEVAGDATAEAVGRAGDQDGRLLDRSHARQASPSASDMRTYVRALEEPGDRGGGAGAPAGLRARPSCAISTLRRRSTPGSTRSTPSRPSTACRRRRACRSRGRSTRIGAAPCLPLLLRPPTHEYLDLNAGRDFEKEIVVKVNVPGGAAGRAGAAVVEARARRARARTPTRTSGSRGATS